MQSVLTIADTLFLFFIMHGFVLPHLYISVLMLFMPVKTSYVKFLLQLPWIVLLSTVCSCYINALNTTGLKIMTVANQICLLRKSMSISEYKQSLNVIWRQMNVNVRHLEDTRERYGSMSVYLFIIIFYILHSLYV